MDEITKYINKDSKKYDEVLIKENRPYLILLIEIKNTRFAIPFRTNINHKYAYIFKSTHSKFGLDFTKSIILEKDEFVEDKAYINDLEYIELNTYFPKIKKKFIQF